MSRGRAGSYRGVGRGFGGEASGWGYTSPSFDRICTECGQKIKGQAHDKPLKCPFASCGKDLVLRTGSWDEHGWGRCISCDNFTNKEFSYCQCCGRANEETKARKKRLAEKERQKLAFDNAQENKRLKAEIESQEEKLQRQKQEIDELNAILKQQEEEKLKKQLLDTSNNSLD